MPHFDRIGPNKDKVRLANEEGLHWRLPTYESVLPCRFAMLGDIAAKWWMSATEHGSKTRQKEKQRKLILTFIDDHQLILPRSEQVQEVDQRHIVP